MTGRPPKLGGPFEARLTVRLSVDDALVWRASAAEAGLGLSDWLRAQVAAAAAVPGATSGRGARRRQAEPADPRILWLFSNLTSNINQLSRSCNSTLAQGEPIQLIHVLEVLKKIHDAAHGLLSN